MFARTRLSAGLATCALALALAGPSAATAAEPSTAFAAGDGKERVVTLSLEVDRFVARGARLYARGTATTRVLTRDGKVRRRRQAVAFQAQRSTSGCRILYLQLEDLQLQLLGLNVNTSTITLRITGSRSAVLGRLFCRLSNGLKLNRTQLMRESARSLNRRLKKQPMRVMGLRALAAPVAQSSQAATSCDVLRLVLGPLDLDLLGLKVDLYGENRRNPVVVEITANAAGGVLGSLFCQLANTNVTLTPR